MIDEEAAKRLFRGTHQPSETVYRGMSPAVGGPYSFTPTGLAMLGALSSEEIIRLRRRMLIANQRGEPLLIDSAFLQRRQFGPVPPFSTLADELLTLVMRKAARRSQAVTIYGATVETRVEVESLLCVEAGEDEILFMLQYLKELGLITFNAIASIYVVTLKPAAFIYMEERQREKSSSSRAFVAMWFNDFMQSAWQEGIEPAIQSAGYEAFRVDRHEHVNRIDDEILAKIRTSRFLIADFTSEPEKARGGVYFEAGFALGLEKHVIWTAHERMIDEIHFDTRQYNHIFWSSPADLQEKLRNRILAVLGQGPLPVASVV
jgi:hypothetical protein